MSINPLRAALLRPSTSIFIPRTPNFRSFRNPTRRWTSTSTSTSSSSTSSSHNAQHSHAHGHGHNHSHPNPSPKTGKKPSPHLVWYREIVPAMIPIFLISTTLFLSLSLVRTHLSHSKSLAESNVKIAELEAQLTQMRVEQKKQLLREKRERERILPLVVERVLQRVGVVGGEEEEGSEEGQEEIKELPRLL
ncbi:uncharacterized protein I303_103347 [Kwoniella dejecticola CBS 10117]|uniref:Uncharacterized protein n=1 Tax=Kwoniella dejecticola CBS 10117 TaxID=1296121 RepID=A0A1A6A6H9_9TREE|nr:uncharacterized protein I303_03370 [Kwoniella dejecticola CBS 10117]OBR85659.1 hypothetical protein I303_03370 [Kwoniella dejecticola CBS 10117]